MYSYWSLGMLSLSSARMHWLWECLSDFFSSAPFPVPLLSQAEEVAVLLRETWLTSWMSNLKTQLGMISAVHNTQLFAWQLQGKALTKVQGACAPAQDQTLIDTFRKPHTSSSRASFPSIFTYWNLKHRREGWGWRDELSRCHRMWDVFPEGRNVILGLGGGFLGAVWVCFAHQEPAWVFWLPVVPGQSTRVRDSLPEQGLRDTPSSALCLSSLPVLWLPHPGELLMALSAGIGHLGVPQKA